MTLMRAQLFAVAAAVSLGAAGGPAVAASHDLATFIREQDKNGDGKVSKDEYAAGREREFARMDADKDGGLSHAEYVEDFKARLPKKLESRPADTREAQRERELKQVEVRFGVLDSDKSGKITPAEFAYSGWMMFSTHDTDRDGFVGPNEPAKKDGE
jgi:hypothetical protein